MSNFPIFPSSYRPIHEVHNWAYARRLARAAIRGEQIPPILVEGDVLLAGTHRAAANDILEAMGYGRLIDVVDLSEVAANDDLIEAVEDGDFERIDEIWDRSA